VVTEIEDMNVVRQIVLDELACRVRQQNLAAVAGGANACAPVDAHPDVSLTPDERLACVDPHPHADGDAVGPGLRSERTLRCHRRAHPVTRPRERDEECVALRVDLVTAELFNRRAKQPGVCGKNLVVPVPELLQQSRRPFDVTEEKGDGAGRTLGCLDDYR
jgi:hypothetical protein